MTGSIFGPVVDGDDVERALLAHLRAWMPDYVGFALRAKDPDGTVWPQGVAPVETFTVKHAAEEKWPEDQLPMLLAYCPGLASPPTVEGDGLVTAEFAVTLTAIASGQNINDTKALARVYATAALLAIMQKPDLGGFATHTTWGDGRNFPVTRGVEAERSLMAVANTFAIKVESVLNVYGGPLEVSDDPSVEPDPWPVVEEGKAGPVDTVIRSRIL